MNIGHNKHHLRVALSIEHGDVIATQVLQGGHPLLIRKLHAVLKDALHSILSCLVLVLAWLPIQHT